MTKVFWLATAAWAGISAVLGISLWLAVAHGFPWLLILATIGFIVAVARIGCAAH